MAFLWNKARTGCYPREQMDNQKPDGGTPGVHWRRKHWGVVGVGASAQRGHRAVGEVRSGQQPQAYKGACDPRCLVRP